MVSLMYRFKKNLTKHKIINHYSQLPKYCVVAVIRSSGYKHRK